MSCSLAHILCGGPARRLSTVTFSPLPKNTLSTADQLLTQRTRLRPEARDQLTQAWFDGCIVAYCNPRSCSVERKPTISKPHPYFEASRLKVSESGVSITRITINIVKLDPKRHVQLNPRSN